MKKETYKHKYLFVVILVCSMITGIKLPALGARYITVATIGDWVSPVDNSKGMQHVVEQIEDFWHKKLEQVYPDQPDLIVLPEYCDFPEGMTRDERDEYLRVRKDQIQDFFASEARDHHCYIAFGIRRQVTDGSWRNSCVIVDRSGGIAGIYNKNYPTIGDMKSGVKAGSETPLIQCDFGTVGCAICFDLNFDELRRAYVKLQPDIIVFPSQYHGGLVQSYWAYSCHSFFIGSMIFRGIPSEIRNPLGEVLATSTNYFDYAVTRINLDCRVVHLDNNWEKLSGLKKKYGRSVSIHDPGKLGPVLVCSEDDKITVDQMIKEAGIELFDDYFNMSRKFRQEPGNLE